MNKEQREKKLCQIEMEVQCVWENNMGWFPLPFPKASQNQMVFVFYIHLKCVVEQNVLGKDYLTIFKRR